MLSQLMGWIFRIASTFSALLLTVVAVSWPLSHQFEHYARAEHGAFPRNMRVSAAEGCVRLDLEHRMPDELATNAG